MARSAASSNSEACARGRTIWRKPKPLTAVRSNGCGRISSTAAAAAWRAALLPNRRQVDADRSADAVTPDGPRRRARRRRPPVQTAAGVRPRRSGSSPGSARRAARHPGTARARCALPRAGPTSRPRPAHRRSRERQSRPSSAGAGRRSSSVIRASGRFHGSAPPNASRVTSMLQRAALGDRRSALGQQIFLTIGLRDGIAADGFSAAPPAPSRRE